KTDDEFDLAASLIAESLSKIARDAALAGVGYGVGKGVKGVSQVLKEAKAAKEAGKLARLGATAEVTGEKLGLIGCFAEGTPLLTPQGWKRIEEFREGDVILSAKEFDPAAPVEVQTVRQVFRRISWVLAVRVQGVTLQMTGEHPVYVDGHGW